MQAGHQERMAGIRSVPGGDRAGGFYRRLFTRGGLAVPGTKAWTAGGERVQKGMAVAAEKIAGDDKNFISGDTTAMAVAARGFSGQAYVNEYNRQTAKRDARGNLIMGTGGAQALARVTASFGQTGQRGTRLAATKAFMAAGDSLESLNVDYGVDRQRQVQGMYELMANLESSGVVGAGDGANLIKSAKRLDVAQVGQGNAQQAVKAAAGQGWQMKDGTTGRVATGTPGTGWNDQVYDALMGDVLSRVEPEQLMHAPPNAIKHVGERLIKEIANGQPGPARDQTVALAAKLYTDLAGTNSTNAAALRDVLQTRMPGNAITIWEYMQRAGVLDRVRPYRGGQDPTSPV